MNTSRVISGWLCWQGDWRSPVATPAAARELIDIALL
jgi:hypothetical protein